MFYFKDFRLKFLFSGTGLSFWTLLSSKIPRLNVCWQIFLCKDINFYVSGSIKFSNHFACSTKISISWPNCMEKYQKKFFWLARDMPNSGIMCQWQQTWHLSHNIPLSIKKILFIRWPNVSMAPHFLRWNENNNEICEIMFFLSRIIKFSLLFSILDGR